MASVITEMSTFSPFSISQKGLKIQVNSTQNCDSAKISQTKFLKTTFKEHCDWPRLGGRRIPEKSTRASHVTKISDRFPFVAWREIFSAHCQVSGESCRVLFLLED